MSWRAICDRCGFEFKSHELRKEWTGLRVCSGCFETRHPQEFLRGKADKQVPPWVRPDIETEVIFLTDEYGGPILTEAGAEIRTMGSEQGLTFLQPGDVTADSL